MVGSGFQLQNRQRGHSHCEVKRQPKQCVIFFVCLLVSCFISIGLHIFSSFCLVVFLVLVSSMQIFVVVVAVVAAVVFFSLMLFLISLQLILFVLCEDLDKFSDVI